MTTGIGDVAVYIPRLLMRLNRLLDRYAPNPTVRGFIERAIEKTGQIGVRFPHHWEDSVTMAAQAALRVLGRMSDKAVASLRFVAVGTETGTDMAKPIASHVSGMLREAGYPIPESIATFQTQHACASGTLSLLGVNALLAQSRPGDRGLVICTDVARYEQGTSAEVTQGAGAVAMIAEQDCGLLELDMRSAGYASRDVDDFFRPVGESTPRVRGKFSMEMYRETIESAFLDHCRQLDRDPREVLRSTDLFAFHAPFHRLPRETLKAILAKYLDLGEHESEEFLRERDFDASLAPAAQCGNLYSGSLFLGLTHLLHHRFAKVGPAIVGQRALLLSYGSGNVAVALSGTVTEKAPQTMAKWDLDRDLNHAHDADLSDYDAWMAADDDGHRGANGDAPTIPADSFYLSGIREDGYRLYGWQS